MLTVQQRKTETNKSIRCAVYTLLPVSLPSGVKQKPEPFKEVRVVKSQRAHMYGLSIPQYDHTANASSEFIGIMADRQLQNSLQMITPTARVVWLKIAITGVLYDQITGETKTIKRNGIFGT